jgi:hypothetical protein
LKNYTRNAENPSLSKMDPVKVAEVVAIARSIKTGADNKEEEEIN